MKTIKFLELVPSFIGMALVTMELSMEFAILTWLFLILVGVVVFFYHKHEGKGILAGLIAISLFSVASLYLVMGSSIISVCFQGLLGALGGSVVVWFGGMIGMIVSEIIRFLYRKVYPSTR